MSWKNNWNKFVRNGIVTERKKTMNERWNDFVTGQDKQNKSKQIRESWMKYLQEDEQRETAVVYFGGFKPPHKGHLEIVKDYLSMPQVSKVYVIFGHSTRRCVDKNLCVTGEDAESVWNMYVEHEGIGDKVEIMPISGSPMLHAAMMAFNDELKGMDISPGFSPKEPAYGERFVDMVNTISRKEGEPQAKPVLLPTEVNFPDISATKLRNAISKKDVDTIEKMIPDGISPEDFLSLFS